MVASWRSSWRDAVGIPRQMRGERWIRPLRQCERRSGLSKLSWAVPHVRDQPRVRRFLAGGDLRSLGGCSAVTH